MFCGSCSVESKVEGFSRKILNDKHEYLIELLNGVKNGYDLPEHISEEEYKYIREHKDEDKVLTGFVGFGCSFAGKWFGGYARNKQNHNYCKASKNSLMKKMSTMADVEFDWRDYKSLFLKGCLIYCDPPYANTTKYTGVPDFDSEEFWNIMRAWSKDNDVYISEYEAPDDFVSVLDIPTKTNIRDKSDNVCNRVEKLFKYKG